MTVLRVMPAVHKVSAGFEVSEILLDLVADWVEADLQGVSTRRACAAYVGWLQLDQEWDAFH